MAQRYCTNCGAELPEDARFCGDCGRPALETAAVSTPEADVDVPPLPSAPGTGSGPTSNPNAVTAGKDGTKNVFIVGGVVWLIAVIGTLVSGSGNGTLLVVVVGIVLFVVATRTDDGASAGKDGAGRLVLREGDRHPVPQAERSRLLDEEVGQYMRDGFFVRHRMDTTAQLVKPKKFSFLWALLWLLVFGVGIVVYLIYYAAKRDEGRYVEVDGYGAVRATRQVHHVL